MMLHHKKYTVYFLKWIHFIYKTNCFFLTTRKKIYFFFHLKLKFMDLRNFIQIHKDNNSINSIVDGFEKSSFVEPGTDIHTLIKVILNSLLSDDGDKQKIYNQLQSGGLANVNVSKNETSKKQSFCTEFNQMISNILGLFGVEFSKYLFVLMGAKQMITQEIEKIKHSQNYEEILKHVIYIKNIINLGMSSDYLMKDNITVHNKKPYVNNTSKNEPAIDIDEDFYREYYNDVSDKKINQNYLEIELKNKKNDFFEQIILEIKQLIKSENVLSFEDDRNEWYNMFTEMLSHLIFNTYYINSIDDLCLNLNGVNVCYDKSFIKMFEILYKESFADIPHELWSKYKPHISYIEKELKLDIKCNKYLNSFNKYFHKIYDETYKHTAEKLYQNEILKVHISDEVYELLSDIVFNLYVDIAKKIACNQLTYAYFGKSTRIQFIQMFQALMDCSPRLYVFTKSQRMVLHYILLSKKVINDSIKNSLNTPDEEE